MYLAVIAAWPGALRLDRRRFEMLKRAYVEARYSDQYDLSPEDLAWLTDHVKRLRDVVDQVCRERIAALMSDA